jgi:hypothetical protein
VIASHYYAIEEAKQANNKQLPEDETTGALVVYFIKEGVFVLKYIEY